MTDAKILEAVARGLHAYYHADEAHLSDKLWRQYSGEAQAAIDAYVEAVSEAQAQARIPRTLKDCGYAPGWYQSVCRQCDEIHIADKRAWRCLKCAEALLAATDELSQGRAVNNG